MSFEKPESTRLFAVTEDALALAVLDIFTSAGELRPRVSVFNREP